MRCVEVRAGRPYEVFIGRGLMDAAGGMIVEALGGTRMAAILTDDTVDALYGARVEQALSESGLRTCRFAMPHGEAHKTLATWEKMLAFLSEQGMTRVDVVVALGGNEKNAFLSGINVTRYKMIVYAISGLFCAVASIVFVARIDSITSNAGTNYETNALAAAIIGGVTFDGGKGTIGGAFLGCLLMGVISNAMNILGVDTNVQTIITGAIIVGAVVLSNINNIRKK